MRWCPPRRRMLTRGAAANVTAVADRLVQAGGVLLTEGCQQEGRSMSTVQSASESPNREIAP